MKLDIVILAAGQGKRMRSCLPKTLHTIANIPMLERVVTTAQTLKPHKVYIVHGNHGAMVKERLQHLPVTWIEQKQQLGTAHAVSQLIDLIPTDHNVLILYGDVPLITSELLHDLIKQTANQAGLITAIMEDPTGLGRIIRNEQNHISAIVEHDDADLTQLKINEINTGIMLLPAKLLKEYLPQIKNNNAQQEYYLTDIVALAVKNGEIVHGVIASDSIEIMGVNDKAQLAEAERHFQLRQAKKLMRQGLTLRDPARFDLRGELVFGNDVIIDINVLISGKVKLGNNVQILANTVIEDAIIENGCVVGPFARIRPDSHLKTNSKVGNFVELKKTILGENSKASHLSYLGDTIIGKNVNIGAGTITCNYDGVSKYQTTIKDGVFIGSNTALVAPVSVSKNATIGAGSVITDDAPPNKLTLARSRQVTIEDWQRPQKKPEKK